jgi:hypothetical protein
MNGNVPVEALLRLREDMVGDGGGRYSGGMKPPMDEKSNGYVDRGDFIYTLMRNGPSPHYRACFCQLDSVKATEEAQRGG